MIPQVPPKSRLYRRRRRQHQNRRVSSASFTTSQQQHIIHYSSPISTSLSSSECTTANTIIKSNNNNNSNNNNIQVSQITSNHDILSLADLRYQEWMSNDPNPPSLHNFRLATVDICQERCMDGAMIFLAKKTTDDEKKSSSSSSNNNWGDESVVVGAAELSPIELKDVIVLPTYKTIEHQQSQQQSQQQQQQQLNNNLLQYVTDVVTSSTSRRLGVGSTLMNAIEKSAWDMGTRCLLLHVEVENELARRFYDKLNYIPVVVDQDDEDDDEITTTRVSLFGVESIGVITSLNLEESVGHTVYIDVDRLALNAGTPGQLLLMKELSSEPPVLIRGEEVLIRGEEVKGAVDASRGVVKGFGMKSAKRKQKKKMAR